MKENRVNADKMIQAGVLAWLIPGGGHFLLGHRALGAVFFAAISFTFFFGLALGGIKNSVNPFTNRWLFLAELGTGGYTVASYVVNLKVGEIKPQQLATPRDSNTPDPRDQIDPDVYAKYVSFYPAADVAQIYLATAGLLNLLAILDALTRAQTGGLPTYYRELAEHLGPPAGGKP
ncbi:MAG: hypothetical protein JXO22_12950 [Phycisphaerae bacterium]|nr:hypothetical protein [Phycisphaerae bacterium]